MSIDQIEWSKLKPYRQDKRASFEQLCYQLALALLADQGSFTPIDDSGGGSGVEFYLELPDKTIWGWQAKFYPGAGQRLTSSRRKHITESLVASKRKYGDRLARWYLCTPIDLADVGKSSELRWFQDTLRRRAGVTQLLHWGESELLRLLRDPRANGIVQFFFGAFQPSPQWFQAQVRKELLNLGDKYVPELHTGTSTDFEIHTVIGDAEFRRVARNVVKKLRKGIREFAAAVSNVTRVRDQQFASELARAASTLESLTPVLNAALLKADQFARDPLNLTGVRESSVASREAIELASTKFGVLPQYTEPINATMRALRPEGSESSESRRLRALLETLRKPGIPMDGIMTDLVRLQGYVRVRLSRALHLVGGPGSGKTHALAQLCSTQSGSAILLRGASFSRTGTIQMQVLRQLGLQINWADFLDALDIYAKTYGVDVLLAIDALNEAEDIGLWQRELRGFEDEFKARSGVSLVTSVRKSYVGPIWRDAEASFCYVAGFRESEAKNAIRKYFQYYRISATLTLSALRHFEHPLYLRIFCEATNRDRTDVKAVFLGEQSLFSVFDNYLDKANESFSVSINRAPEGCVLHALLRKFAGRLWSDNARHLPLEDAVLLLDGKGLGQVEWSASVTKALLDEELILSRSYYQAGEGLAFSYDALAGYLIAEQALQTLPDNFGHLQRPDAVSATTRMLGSVVSDDWRARHPLHEDILRSIAALFPARTGTHLAYVAENPEVLTAGVNAFFEMDPRYLGPREVNAVAKLFGYPSNRSLLLDGLRNTAFAPGHPLDARFMHALLSNLSMLDRDLYWSEYMRSNSAAVSETIKEFAEACRGPLPSPEHKRQLRNAALYVSWVLTSNNRYLRDVATRALLVFGTRFPRCLFGMTEDSLICNDPYRPERLLAASYGAGLALQCRPTTEKFRDKDLPLFARRVFNYLFAENAPFPTTHALRRDYARQIVNLALHWRPGALTGAEKERLNKPLPGVPRKWRRRPDYHADSYKEGNDPLGMDWENYTMGSLVPDRANYDYKNPEFIEVKEKILWRIHDLGYSLARFGEIDKEIWRSGWYREMQGAANRIDRYGKKYAWIAFYELYGLRDDQGVFRDDWLYDCPHPLEADIDPCFPLPPHRVRMLKEDILGKDTADATRWVAQGPSPDFRHYLTRNIHEGEPGPWLLLYASFTRFKKEWRNGFAFIRGFFVRDAEFKKACALLRTDKVRSGWLPRVPQARGYYAGEFPWRCDFPYSSPEQFRVPRGKKRVKVEVPQFLLELDGMTIRATSPGRGEWRDEATFDLFDMASTVQDLPFDGHSAIDRVTGTTPSKQLCEHLRLWLRLPFWDTYDPAGRRASVTTGWGSIGNHDKTVYMRRDLVDKYLADNALKLIWIVWGERQRLSRSGNDAGYKQYGRLYLWAEGRVARL